MTKGEYIHKRKARYMARVLEAFEEHIDPHLPDTANGSRQHFKSLVREHINALAVDAVDVMSIGEDERQNGLALEFRDQLPPTVRT